MAFLCLWAPAWNDDSFIAIQSKLLRVVPRIYASNELLWVDIRGMSLFQAVNEIKSIVDSTNNIRMSIGVADTPIAAEVAARYSQQVFTRVLTGNDREYLSKFPVTVLHPDTVTDNLMSGAGIERCGELASLTQEAVEVRFGSAGVKLWRLARANDARRIFSPIVRSLPEAGCDWTDYTIKRAERLVFVLNALCGNVCDALESQGNGAISMMLSFSLVNRTSYSHPIRAARPTANRSVWMRLLRTAIEKIQLSDGVVGINLRVDSVAGLGSKQGDLFDSGFTTAKAAGEAVGNILDNMGNIVVYPESSDHPLVERRTVWNPVAASNVIDRVYKKQDGDVSKGSFALTLQLFSVPIKISVNTGTKHNRIMPASYWNSGRQYTIIDVAGPDIVEGGEWGQSYAREYYRCVNNIGVLIWMYRDISSNIWYLHGWWD